MTGQAPSERRRRGPLIAIALLFVGPLAAAWFVYFAAPEWRPEGSVSHGVLIEPPVPLPDLAFAGPGGDALAPELLRQRWTLIYVDDGACRERCRDALFRTHQVRMLLHRDLDRVRRIYFYRGEAPDDAFVAEQAPDLVIADAASADAPALLASLPAADGSEVYLVDPLGNLMMRFPLTGSWQDMHKDLKKLLRLSRIG